MYLLKRLWAIHQREIANIFTFHNVPIKTRSEQRLAKGNVDLHSTMYLLKRDSAEPKSVVDYIYIPQCTY